MYLKLPPEVKVLEALSAVFGNRIQVINDYLCIVKSSDLSRTYIVYLDLSNGFVYSNDNGTTYRNYIGYPIISFLMIKGILPKNERIGRLIKDIPWRKINEELKSYSKVMNYIITKLKQCNVNEIEVRKYINEVMSKLSRLRLKKLEKLPDEIFKKLTQFLTT